METEDPLSQLADIHLPTEVGFWPPAFGWWVLAAILAVALVLLARRLLAALAVRRREAAALRELEACLRRYHEGAFTDANAAGLIFLADVNAVLRRVALFHYPSADVAGLYGKAWLAFLDARDGGDAFTAGPGRALGEGQYRRVFDADTEGLYDCARGWIQRRYRVRESTERPASLGEAHA